MSMYHFSDTEAVEHDVNTVPAFGDFERVEIDGQWYVPERTCRDTDHMHDAIKCSECGEITLNTLYRVEYGGGLTTVKGHRPRFCSNCGARVEDE